jgi:MOSC domain-containing protein YiiM
MASSTDGTVANVFIAPEPEVPPESVAAVEAVPRRGLRGDRYFRDEGTFTTWGDDEERPAGYDLTLIETEAVAAVEREAGIGLRPGEHRRNVETRGVALNHLVGERFRVGTVVCRGDRLCEPCDHLERLTEEGVHDAFVHRGGLRADILEGGTIRPGDVVRPVDD